MLIFHSAIVCIGVLLNKVQGYIEDGNLAEEFQNKEWLAPSYEQYQAVTPPCCQPPGLEDAHIVLISTMNGKLFALDGANNGNVLWQIDLEGSPLLSGTLSRMPPMESNGRWYHLVPALDGSLYMYSRDDRVLEPIPLNTEILLQSSVKIAQDAVAGGHSVSTTGVDPLTGEIRYHCTAATCNNGYNEDVQATLVFRRSTNSVRAVNALTGAERWNLSVSEYEASLVKKSNTLPYNNRISGLRLLVQPPDGIITAYDGCGNLVWSQNVGSHIVKSWKIESGELSEISLFDAYNIHTLAVAEEFTTPEESKFAETLFYLGMSNNDPFIIHSNSVKSELQKIARNALEATEIVHQPGNYPISTDRRAYFMQGRTLDDLLRFNFGKSYSAQRRDELTDQRRSELVVVNPNRDDGHFGSCANGDGVSLIKEDDMRSATFDEGPGDKGWFVLKPGRSSKKTPFLIRKAKQCAAHFVKKHGGSFWSFSMGWVAGIMTGMLTFGILIAYGCYKRRKMLPKMMELRDRMIGYQQAVANRAGKIVTTRETSSGPSLAGISDSIPSTPTDGTPTAIQNSESLEKRLSRGQRTISGNSTSSENYTSKFLHDFEPEKLLGHGGFGYVYQARNRLDEGLYAVKRIAVADNQSAIDKVLREVRAMAKLDHRGIIRYFHTWIERPPVGWQEDTDRETLDKLKTIRNKFDEQSEDKIVEEPSQAPPSPRKELARQDSVEAPPMPDDSDDGSWLGSSDKSESSSSGNSSDDENSSDSGSDLPVISRKIGKNKKCEETEDSDIIFGSKARSKTSKSSEDLFRNSSIQQLVLVTSANEELLPSRNTENVVYLYIQMQLCQGKTLHSWLKHHKQLEHRKLETMKGWLVQLTSAVNYIHSQGMIHRDLKPQNIFFVEDDHTHLKVGDLGLVTGHYDEENIEKPKLKKGSLHTGNVGTRGYMSPEQIKNKDYSSKIDVFSLGLIYCELLIPFTTFMERSRTLGSLQRGEIPAILDNVEKAEKEMVLWMTKFNPSDRPTTDELLSSEYFELLTSKKSL